MNICMVSFRVRISRLPRVIRPPMVSKGGKPTTPKISLTMSPTTAGDLDDDNEAVVRAPQTQTPDSSCGSNLYMSHLRQSLPRTIKSTVMCGEG